MAITKAVENNKAILKVGLHFEFGDCRYSATSGSDAQPRPTFAFTLASCPRNRVAVQLQKNLDRIRLQRLAERLSEKEKDSNNAGDGGNTSNRTGGFLGSLPGQLTRLPARHKTPETEEDDEEYEYYEEDGEGGGVEETG